MIEIHFHCLPGIDDGPESFAEAVELCRRAGEEGTTTIIATPHVLRERWINDDPSTRDELILKLNTLLGGTPAILPGAEMFFGHDLLDVVERGEAGPATRLARGSHLLIEFPSTYVPRGAEAAFHELRLMGVIPVIAHPERNAELAVDLDRLAALVALGAKTQITAAAVAGDLSPGLEEVVDRFLARDLIHFVASDAHNLERRPPRLAAARAVAEREWGTERTSRIFDVNPELILPVNG